MRRISTSDPRHGHRPGRGEYGFRCRPGRRRADDRRRWRRDRVPGDAPLESRLASHPRRAREADRLARAGGGRARGPLLRQERPLGAGRRPGPRGRDAGGRPARDPVLRLHAAGGEDGCLRQRRSAPSARCRRWSARCSASPARPNPITPRTRSRLRSATRATPAHTARRKPRCSGRCPSDDRLGPRRGPRAPPRSRGDRVGRRRLPADGLGRDPQGGPGPGQGGDAPRPARRPRRLDDPLRVRQRGGARPLRPPHLRLGHRPEGRDRDPLRRRPARAAPSDRGRRREALPGRARRSASGPPSG